jgi:hypothetical protein
MFRKNFLGIGMAQNQYAVPCFDNFFNSIQGTPPKQIIELGTAQGGLSILLQLYSITNNCKFITYDIKNNVFHKSIFKSLNIDLRVSNIFNSEEEIANIIKQEGTTVLLCDNGSKVDEFNLFAKYLKTNDFIMAHDYSHDNSLFLSEIKHKYWDWLEIEYSKIEKSVIDYNLEYFMKEEWKKASWCCFRKYK